MRRILCAFIAFALIPSFAFAHAALVSGSPKADSAAPAPRTIRLTFSEKIAPAFSGISLSMDDGMVIDVAAKLSDDGKTLTGTPTSSFMKGKYKLSWHVAAVDDGHKTEGSYSFTVK